jgi:hypothetical protein
LEEDYGGSVTVDNRTIQDRYELMGEQLFQLDSNVLDRIFLGQSQPEINSVQGVVIGHLPLRSPL